MFSSAGFDFCTAGTGIGAVFFTGLDTVFVVCVIDFFSCTAGIFVFTDDFCVFGTGAAAAVCFVFCVIFTLFFCSELFLTTGVFSGCGVGAILACDVVFWAIFALVFCAELFLAAEVFA